MIRTVLNLSIVIMCCVTIPAWSQSIPLSVQKIEPVNVKLEDVSYKGKKALRIMASGEGETIAIIKNQNFESGIIELDVAGTTLPNAGEGARGFIGLAFRVRNTDSIRYECFYIRPTNGRAEDQLRRNHSVQYISHPKYTWFKLREENPGAYESYADMVIGEWTHLKIEVKDDKARLYVNGASQPCLIVQDLKSGKSSGAIALWVGPGTDGYFSNLQIGSLK
ncbi:MAG: hypothetical protein J0L67_05330 [Cytophagales bacterium]|nr:hypothetical protein [Cytophagales bacterium]